jgi:hypothetical protein
MVDVTPNATAPHEATGLALPGQVVVVVAGQLGDAGIEFRDQSRSQAARRLSRLHYRVEPGRQQKSVPFW